MTDDTFTPSKEVAEIFKAAEMLNQLRMFPRFRDFCNLNYDIFFNEDENGVHTIAVTEALPEEVSNRMKQAAQEAMRQEMEEIKIATPEQLKEIIGK